MRVFTPQSYIIRQLDERALKITPLAQAVLQPLLSLPASGHS